MPAVMFYTVDEAERALLLVRRIVTDIVATFTRREQTGQRRRALGAPLNPGSRAEEEAFRLEREIEIHEDDLRRYLAELDRLGVELKDWRKGLIDFHSRFRGRDVYLCWMLGEGDHIGFYHEIQAGFTGRQPITPDNRQEFKGSGSPSEPDRQATRAH
ncbi:MAG: DUF2203 domain-containing protein [Planctomycetes bacterium]|nr:DUF2203 domain-containing protein [Planctomycetota bacterium]